MKILVTGGCGFVGANLCLSLRKNNHRVFSLDNLVRKSSKINHKILIRNKIKNYNFDVKNYKRLRVGIGHPGIKSLVSSYVLEKFPENDMNLMDNKLSLLIKNFSLFFTDESLLLTKISL